MTNSCKMCATGQMGFTWTKQVLKGEKTAEAAAAFFGITIENVYEHINSHEIKVVSKEKVGLNNKRYESDDIYLNELLCQFNILKDWIAYFNPDNKNDITLHNITALTKLSREIRETLTTIAAFQGRLTQEGQVNNILKIEQRFYELSNIILQESCPECKSKLLKILEQPLNLENTNLIRTT